MPEQRLDIGQLVQRPALDGAVRGAGIQLVGAAAEGEAEDAVAVLREDAQRGEVGGGPDDEALVGAAGRDEAVCGRGGDSEDGGGVVLVGGGVGFVDVAAGAEESFGAPAEEWEGGVLGVLVFLVAFFGGWRRRGGEFPFCERHVFGDGVDVGRADGNGGRGEGVGAEMAF